MSDMNENQQGVPSQQPIPVPPHQAQPQHSQPQSYQSQSHQPQAYAYQPQHQGAPASTQPSGSVKVVKKGGGVKTFFIAFAGAACACLLVLGGWSMLGGANMGGGSTGGDSEGSAVVPGDQGGSGSIVIEGNEDPTLAEAVAQKCLPSVVAIDVYASMSSMYGAYGMFGAADSNEMVEASLGSGVVLTEDGYIITNYHVIEGGDAFAVTIEGVQYEAEVVGSDPSSDIAVIKAVSAEGLTPMEIGDSDSLIIGEWVMTLGSPFGLEQSVATGIVSATSRSQIMEASVDMYGQSTGETTIYPNMIQTDAAINPGNSGGALVDAEGKLIGINTLITSYSGNYSGVGFAIPVNYAYSLAQQIIEGGEPTHAQLGVSLSTINSAIAQRYGFSVDEGAYVAYVYPDTGAAAAGLQEGDIIVAFDGKAVGSATDLMLDVRTKAIGDVVVLTIDRNGEMMDVEVTLGSDAQSLQEEEQEATTQQNRYSQLFDYFFGGDRPSFHGFDDFGQRGESERDAA